MTEHQQTIESLRRQSATLDAIIDLIVGSFRRGGRLFLFGNGGSAADAQHIAAELTGRFRQERRALPALALTTDTSALTAIGNDYAFARVFARQLEALSQPGDLAWGLSTSGNSPNVVAALERARAGGLATLGFTGRGGGAMAALCDVLLSVDHTATDRIQEAHQLAYHYVCEQVEAAFVA